MGGDLKPALSRRGAGGVPALSWRGAGGALANYDRALPGRGVTVASTPRTSVVGDRG